MSAIASDGPDADWLRSFRRRLLSWFSAHARDLPWRRTRDPYCIWVSEIMLQQTQVTTVVGYYERFLQRFPNVVALATAEEEDVLRLWEGLGYYRRARQMHLAARRIVAEHGGEFPRDPEQVRRLPGVGRYTAGAVLSFAFDDRQPILEANTIRLFTRLLGYRDDPTQAAGQRRLWAFAEDLLPAKNAGQLNQALMELGSLVCTPRSPQCSQCPVATLCPTQRDGLQAVIPAPKRPPQYEDVREVAMVVWRAGTVLLRRCEPNERWAGLWDFPRFAIDGEPLGEDLSESLVERTKQRVGVTVAPRDRLATLRHGVTRFRITLECYAADFLRGRPRGETRWVTPAELADMPLCVTGRRLSRLLTRTGA